MFYIKDLFKMDNESIEAKENRLYCSNYYKYNFYKIIDIINMAYNIGFKLIKFEVITKNINEKDFADSLKLNLVKYKLPHPGIGFLIPAEFLFIK